MSRLFFPVAIVSLLTISALAQQKKFDVSAIIKKAEAESILGEPVKDPTPLNVENKDGRYSKCNYYSAKSPRALVLRVREAVAGAVDPQKEFEQVSASGGAMKPIEGLGERAGMFEGIPQNGLPDNVIMLYVVKGKYFITVGIGGLTDQAAELERAKSIARKILAQI